MSSEFEQNLDRYADVIVKIGLNLLSGQRLMIGAPIETAPLVRLVAAKAYRVGARLVDVMWDDDQLKLIRLQHAARESLDEFPAWRVEARIEAAKVGDALLWINAEDPDLLLKTDPDLVTTLQNTRVRHTAPLWDLVSKSTTNWASVVASADGWAAKIFPDLPPESRKAKLWEVIFDICRVKQSDPISAWNLHVDQLAARSEYLNHKQYTALKMTAPGTDLTIGLVKGHIWSSAQFITPAGVPCVVNLPTEEIGTTPHREKVEGVVTATKPLIYGGILIEGLSLIFSAGRVVDVAAKKGEASLCRLLETDEGARALGEISLVPHRSPISQTGLVFYNTLVDENASSHLALGGAYRANIENGEALSDDEFVAAGCNLSMIHTDFMIGSGEMDVDGLTEDGIAEPVMRSGEWAFEL